ncbi:hypothetical protein D4R08_05075 [Corynebacterium xerosis]|nr:hypothetical protein D4R08_05075 [Corynebacterium xerosis]
MFQILSAADGALDRTVPQQPRRLTINGVHITHLRRSPCPARRPAARPAARPAGPPAAPLAVPSPRLCSPAPICRARRRARSPRRRRWPAPRWWHWSSA